ncbi:MAG: hypothetical protein HYX75_17440 [Acidobacteria bacterium]|nr:hypothetical protein [Acidobacteriota bacterium]
MTRDQVLFFILALPAAALLNAGWHGLALHRFLVGHIAIASSRDLDDFRNLVRSQMRAALVQIFLLVGPYILFFLALYLRVLTSADLALVILPGVLIGVAGAAMKKLESRVQQLPVADPLLEKQRDALVRRWTRSPFFREDESGTRS